MTHHTTLVHRCAITNALLAHELEREFDRLENARMAALREIEMRVGGAHDQIKELREVLMEALAVHGTEEKFLPDPEEHSWCAKARVALARTGGRP